MITAPMWTGIAQENSRREYITTTKETYYWQKQTKICLKLVRYSDSGTVEATRVTIKTLALTCHFPLAQTYTVIAKNLARRLQVNRFSSSKSCYLFGPRNKLRKFTCFIVTHQYPFRAQNYLVWAIRNVQLHIAKVRCEAPKRKLLDSQILETNQLNS